MRNFNTILCFSLLLGGCFDKPVSSSSTWPVVSEIEGDQSLDRFIKNLKLVDAGFQHLGQTVCGRKRCQGYYLSHNGKGCKEILRVNCDETECWILK